MDQALSPFETPGAALAAQAANRGQQEALAFPDMEIEIEGIAARGGVGSGLSPATAAV